MDVTAGMRHSAAANTQTALLLLVHRYQQQVWRDMPASPVGSRASEAGAPHAFAVLEDLVAWHAPLEYGDRVLECQGCYAPYPCPTIDILTRRMRAGCGGDLPPEIAGIDTIAEVGGPADDR
jgi:hypothetical protein